MPSQESVTQWICRIKAGDAVAAQALSDHYFQKLVRLARKKLQGVRRRVADEEDVALSAFDSFCRGAAQGRFPQLSDRNNLWNLLVVITVRKALNLARYERRLKRGGGSVRGESALQGPMDSRPGERWLEQVLGSEPTPEFAAEVSDQCRVLFERLGTGELRSVALWKMEGYTNAEIAAKLGCVEGTVERKLRVIRNLWVPREDD
jgi:DNA-directed RNA polymerase specialized sigma24 family protein